MTMSGAPSSQLVVPSLIRTSVCQADRGGEQDPDGGVAAQVRRLLVPVLVGQVVLVGDPGSLRPRSWASGRHPANVRCQPNKEAAP
jgi:hypothetical protein